MADDVRAEEPSVSFQIVVPSEVGDTPALYSNHFHATVTPEDMTLHFGWYAIPPFSQPPDTELVQVPVRPVVKMTVPLNLVQGIITVLQNQLSAWEQNFNQPVPRHPNPPKSITEQAPEKAR